MSAIRKAVSIFRHKPTVMANTDKTQELKSTEALRNIKHGAIGFDTEFTPRRPTKEERMIEASLPGGGAAKRAAVLRWQIIELRLNTVFPVAWEYWSLTHTDCMRRICLGPRHVENKRCSTNSPQAITAIPTELLRILLSKDVVKVGVGIINDITVIWDDLRVEQHGRRGHDGQTGSGGEYPKMAYGNLALKTSVQDILGYKIDKDLGQSDWVAKLLNEDQVNYAALDAVVSIRLYKVLEGALVREATQTKLSAQGKEILWKQLDYTWYAGGKFQGYP
ncbi:ribonuclease H-like domain-containing protein [Mycena epipterygia]|nr:ribonuclease H-like domain-containing protein [Mycena epipterygia]